jgi:hypothetical protein
VIASVGPSLIDAQVFLDWDSARRIARPPWPTSYAAVSHAMRVNNAKDCFEKIQARVVAGLPLIFGANPIRILQSRIYHGWHRGSSPSEDRRAWDDARYLLRPFVSGAVSFLPDVEFGNNLCCGGARVPLMDTLRDDRQKMVDTALVADLLSYTRSKSSGFSSTKSARPIAIIIADDDDLLPGVFTAEQWGIRLAVLRLTRKSESKQVRTAGLVFDL